MTEDSKFIVEGGYKVNGEINVSGNKNWHCMCRTHNRNLLQSKAKTLMLNDSHTFVSHINLGYAFSISNQYVLPL